MANKVLVQNGDRIARITLNDPATYNALCAELLDELFDAIMAAIKSDNIRAIVITGSGRGFCSGADIGSEVFSEGFKVGDFLNDKLNPVILAIRSSPKPVVTAINGPAAGAGVGLALAGDVVLASEEACFVLSFVKIGASLDAGTSRFVQRAIGPIRARALSLLGETLSARKAEQWGLIWKCCPGQQLLSESEAIARQLAEGPAIAIGLIKQALNFAEGNGLEVTLANEANLQGVAFSTSDLMEGACAFLERRAAKFEGR